ncbi:MAG: 16S rRNA (adenine(1518)-N(6)/adenine(1519)-N(6))-dimethyltransferase [Propionibacteriaceae bacterium]|jgi:16S rRNA (adenine1518-N6/adenine1519-N6)-dimethyltransferase|nr:16S rRNA (adenine(1518)-N(6)/adenine(1519)-N(6))-dimethyltransferase [Propionibacteriaceae bacterium]
MAEAYLDATTIRRLAAELGLRPSKQRGQNFVHDANTVRRIVVAAGVEPGDVVLEVGPGLGSLTAGLLAAGASVVAVEIEPSLARRLARTMAELGHPAERLTVLEADALTVSPGLLGMMGSATTQGSAPASEGAARPGRGSAEALGSTPASEGAARPGEGSAGALGSTPASQGAARPGEGSAAARGSVGTPPTRLVANLPYNVAVPVLLRCLAEVPSLQAGLVMVQLEVADRLVAGPGSKVYGAPSAKLAWHAEAARAGTVPASVFWPAPNVESGLVRWTRRDPPTTAATREAVFAVVDAAFGQRRKMLRSALAARFGGATAKAALAAAGISEEARGETLAIEEFARLAEALALS